jgi:tetratricopeptide (TPR) repeat protein
MSVTTAINRFITTSVAGLYQGLIASGLGFQEVANRLIKTAENAHAFRQYDRLHEAGKILSNFPLKQYQYIGQYYLALSMCRNGQVNILEARPFIEKLASVAPIPYRARAMQLLAATYGTQRNPEQELSFFVESLKTRASTFLGLQGIALLKAKEGYHKQSLKDLENLRSFARYMPPHIYFDYLNSLAVELGEAGRKDEARNIIKHVLASPFAIAYPEWRETAEELREPNRSFAVISSLPLRPHNVLSMPAFERDGAEFPTWAGQPAPVLSYEKWTQRMAKKKKNGNKPIEQMTESDMIVRIINIYASEDTTDAQRRKMYDAMMKALSEPDKPEKPDDHNPGA